VNYCKKKSRVFFAQGHHYLAPPPVNLDSYGWPAVDGIAHKICSISLTLHENAKFLLAWRDRDDRL